MPDLPLNLRIDERATLAYVASADEVRHAAESSFTVLLRHSAEPAHRLFPDAEDHVGGEVPPPAWWTQVRAHISDLYVFKIRDAYVLPASGVVVTARGDVMRLTMEEATYASEDLTHLPEIERRDGRPVLVVPDAVERIPRGIVTMPYGAVHNYGHFLLDGLSSLAALADTGCFDDDPVLVPPLKPWQARHFALFGVEPRVVNAGIIRVDEVVYTSAMHHFLHCPNLNYRSLRDRQVARLGTGAGRSGRRRLYLARNSGNRRTMASERRLMRRLRQAGFEIVDPARSGVDGQIAMFREAEVVIGVTGSAFANALYCGQGTLVVEIQPHGMENHWVLPLCQIMGLRHAAYFCGRRRADAAHPERDMDFDIDVDRFLAFAFGFPPLKADDRPRPIGGWLGGLFRRG